jgi:hypothetical protein
LTCHPPAQRRLAPQLHRALAANRCRCKDTSSSPPSAEKLQTLQCLQPSELVAHLAGEHCKLDRNWIGNWIETGSETEEREETSSSRRLVDTRRPHGHATVWTGSKLTRNLRRRRPLSHRAIKPSAVRPTTHRARSHQPSGTWQTIGRQIGHRPLSHTAIRSGRSATGLNVLSPLPPRQRTAARRPVPASCRAHRAVRATRHRTRSVPWPT